MIYRIFIDYRDGFDIIIDVNILLLINKINNQYFYYLFDRVDLLHYINKKTNKLE